MALTAIIPAAGEGTRLRPHTYSLPKALLPVAGKPVLAHILDPLVAVGVDRVILVLGHLSERVSAWVRERYPHLAVEVVLQPERLGLGHAVWCALAGARLFAGPGLIILGDTIVRADLAGLLATPGHGMGVRTVEDPRRFGVAVTEGGRIVGLEEKPQRPRSNLALVGLYHVRDLAPLHAGLARLIAEGQRTRGEYQLTDALQGMIEAGERLSPFVIDGWFDVGKEESWLETNRDLLAGAPQPKPRPGVRFHSPVAVPDSAEIAGSEIGPFVSLGDAVKIADSRIANSIVGEGCVITACGLRDSLIGARSVLSGLNGHYNLGEDCVATQTDPSPGAQR